MTWLWILLAASLGACFGYVLCGLLIGRRAAELDEARRVMLMDQAALCDRCREMDEDRADADEFNRL